MEPDLFTPEDTVRLLALRASLDSSSSAHDAVTEAFSAAGLDELPALESRR